MDQNEVISQSDVDFYASTFENIVENIETSLVGKSYIVKLVLAAMMAKGHILLEDVPGTGKTHLARSLSQSINGTTKRIQFTPDLLPSDITGISVYDQSTREFTFHHGPIFANVVLADEINRTSPKTQSALLEVMEEGKVTLDNHTREVPQPFVVIATQNPIEQAGTYRLPEAQLDRFLIQTSIGHMDHKAAFDVISGSTVRSELSSVVELESVERMRQSVTKVHIDPMLVDYILRIVEATRDATQVKFGSSIRGALGLAQIAKAWAASLRRTYVTLDDVQQLAIPVLGHRIILLPEAEFDGVKPVDVINQILLEVEAPQDRG